MESDESSANIERLGRAKKKKLPDRSCQTCRQMFTPSRTWQQFCSYTCRQEAHKNDRLAEYSCHYCGLVSDTIDHVPPRSVRPSIALLPNANAFPFVEVHACRECNCALGRLALWTLAERKRYMKKWIRRRYKRVLKMPNWSSVELEELAPHMREHVVNGLAVRDITRQRLAW
jgi:hypothetical protein